MAFSDLLVELFKPKQQPQQPAQPQKRGSQVAYRTGLVILFLMVGYTLWSEVFAPRPERKPREQNTAYANTAPVNFQAPKEEQQAEKPPPKEPKPQAETRRQGPPPKPKVETEEQKYRRKARLISNYGGPFGEGWRELADKTNKEESPAPTAHAGQTLEIPAQNGHESNLQEHPLCTLLRGSVIPVILQDEINTRTAGQITARVTQDIRDTATGKCVVIPYGTEVVGQHATRLADYQKEVETRWNRMNFPNGLSKDLHAFPGANQSGAGGVPLDEVNTHFWARVGQSALLTLSGATLRTATSNAYHGGEVDFGSALASQGSIEANRQARQEWGRSGYQGPDGTTYPGKVFLLQVTTDLTVPGDYYQMNGGRSYADTQ